MKRDWYIFTDQLRACSPLQAHVRELANAPARAANISLFRQGACYTIVGAVSVGLDILLLNVAVHLSHVTSGPLLILFASLSFLVAVTNSYYWNGRWTFRTALRWRLQLTTFIGINVVGLLINALVIDMLTAYPALLIGRSPVLRVNEAKLVAVCIAATWNFFAYRTFVFRVE